MTNANQPPLQNSNAWNWPAEWAVERTIWREIGTRTVAGVLTIVILAVPSLLYATIFGLLTLNQVIPILIGIALFALVLVIYIVVLRMIRRRESMRIARALEKDKSRSGPFPTPEQFMGYSAEQRARIMSMFSKLTQDGISQAERLARQSTIWSTLGAVIAIATGVLTPLLFR